MKTIKHLIKNSDREYGKDTWCGLDSFSNAPEPMVYAENMSECDCKECLHMLIHLGVAAEAQLTWLSE